MSKRTVRRLAVWLALALLSAQWLTVAYACPQIGAAAASMVATPAMPCHSSTEHGVLDPAQSSLCKVHCDYGSQALNDLPASQPSPQLMLWAVLDWHAIAPMAMCVTRSGHLETFNASPPGSPPLYLRLQVLRD